MTGSVLFQTGDSNGFIDLCKLEPLLKTINQLMVSLAATYAVLCHPSTIDLDCSASMRR